MSPSEREELKKDVKSFGQNVIIGLLVLVIIILGVVGIQGRDTNNDAGTAAISAQNVETILTGYQKIIDTDLCLRTSAFGVTASLQQLNDALAEQQQLLVDGFAAVVAGDDARQLDNIDKNNKLNPEIDRLQLIYAYKLKLYDDALTLADSDPDKFLKNCSAN